MTQDLMGMLREAFDAQAEANGAYDTMAEGVLADFVRFCRQHLQDNQPVSMEFLATGLSLRFQDGSVVPFLLLAEEPGQVSGIQGGVEITKPTTRRAQPQPVTFSFGITSGK